MLHNLGQFPQNQRQFSNWLLFSRSLFVRDNRNRLLNMRETWSVMSGRDGEIIVFIEKGRSQAHFAWVNNVDWGEPRQLRTYVGHLCGTPSSVRWINHLTLKSWLKVCNLSSNSGSATYGPKTLDKVPRCSVPQFPSVSKKDNNRTSFVGVLWGLRVSIHARCFAYCLAHSRHYFVGTIC